MDLSHVLRRRFPPHLYKLLLDLIIDIFKYRIKDSFDKTPVRRKIERKLKKKRADEIPNLVDLLDVRKRRKAGYKKR